MLGICHLLFNGAVMDASHINLSTQKCNDEILEYVQTVLIFR